MPGTETVSLPLDESVVNALDEEIGSHDLSRPEYIRYIIEVRHDRAELKQDLDRATERVEELEGKLRRTTNRNDDLRQENESLRRERNELQRDLERAESRVEELGRRLREATEPGAEGTSGHEGSRTDGEGGERESGDEENGGARRDDGGDRRDDGTANGVASDDESETGASNRTGEESENRDVAEEASEATDSRTTNSAKCNADEHGTDEHRVDDRDERASNETGERDGDELKACAARLETYLG